MQATKPIVVAAHPLELEGFSGGECVGVGLVEAALGALRVLGRRPARVLLVGSCGAYPGSGLRVGDIVAPREAVLASEGALPAPVPRRVAVAGTRPGRAVVVASPLGVTTSDARAAEIARETGAHVENLEAFAVARACEDAGVPLEVVLGVTNAVGARGREEWRANAARVAAAVLAAVRNPTRAPSPE